MLLHGPPVTSTTSPASNPVAARATGGNAPACAEFGVRLVVAVPSTVSVTGMTRGPLIVPAWPVTVIVAWYTPGMSPLGSTWNWNWSLQLGPTLPVDRLRLSQLGVVPVAACACQLSTVAPPKLSRLIVPDCFR